MNRVVVIVSGLLFGFGLDLGRVTDPERVLGFLDVAGRWDPTLLFVMAGALAVSVPAFTWLRGRGRSWLAGSLRFPDRRDLDGRLLGGAALFGIGWGLAGYCPGPGIAALSHGVPDPAWFVLGMVAGMFAFAALPRGDRE